MEYSALLSLHLSQTEIFINKSRNNSYSDLDKRDYQIKLNSLFSKIKNSIIDNPDISVFEKQEHLRFICTSLEFLKDSTLNSMPFEVVGCLNLAMNEWIDNEFIIVTSLNNNINAFSYDPTLALEDLLYQSIEAQYSENFEKKLVQINLPLILSRDYFSSVVLYHELGHFVDLQYAISRKIMLNLFSLEKMEWVKYYEYLPFNQFNTRSIESHLAEYFCDIFASQYINSTSNYYLQYLTKNSDVHSIDHPSTTNRVKVVNDFLFGNYNPIVELIKNFTKNICSRDLKIRFEEINSDDFYNLLPLEISSPEQLHGVFSYAWKIWMDGPKTFKEKAKINSVLSEDRIYKNLNNLIEKSIGNYFIEQSWRSGI